MTVEFITGRSGSGKTTYIMNYLVGKLNDKKNSRNYILFVPEKMSFQAEYEIAKKVNSKAYTNLQVLSFKRLAYRLFLEVGGLNKTFINDITIEMMITKIIEENREKFLLYNKVSSNLNFVHLIHELLKEFKSYQIDSERLENIINNEFVTEILKKKLHDVALIYNELNALYGKKILDNEDFYQELFEKIVDSEYIKNAEIIIDGYHNFTTVELNVIYQLIKYSKKVIILFTLDDVTKFDLSNEDNLFNLPYRTFMKLKNQLLEENVQIEINHLDGNYRSKHNELTFLEKNYGEKLTYPDNVDNLEIIETESPSSEVHEVARRIYNEVLSGASYSDFVIYINNQEVYYPLIHNVFKLYHIPVFIDDNKLMLDHFLLNFIDASLEVVKTNINYEAIFRAIKTEIFMPIIYNEETLTDKNYLRMTSVYRKRIDLLENYCLSHGIMGNDWKKDYWHYDIHKKLGVKDRELTEKEKQLEKTINETKKEISVVMLKFIDAFKNAKTVKTQISAIYQMLIDLNIERKLEIYELIDSSQCMNNFDLNQAKKHKQVYNKLMELFDELVEVCGDYEINTDELIKILQTGFKGMKFAIVPPAIDQVMVGTLKRSRFEMTGHFDDPKSMGVKQAFVLGVNENEIPKVQIESGLLTNKEREFLIDNELEMMPTCEKAFLDEYFIIYTVLCSPSEKLILSYTLSNNEKKEAFRSEIIENVVQMFPKLKVNTIYDFPEDSTNNLTYITSPVMSSTMLLQAINRIRKGYDVHEIWKSLYGYYKHNKKLSQKLIGVTYQNVASELAKADIKNLYGDIISASVSGIEKFNSCPYAFFLDKGLRIQERDIKAVETMDIGDLYHGTMKTIALKLMSENKDMYQLDIKEIPILVNKIVDDFSSKMQRKFFVNNKQNEYLLYKIKESLIKSLTTMHYQSSHSKFKIYAVEEKFGVNAEKLNVKPIELNSGFKMQLKGFIDRIDVANINDLAYVRIIDYKSGNKDIDFTKIYNRLSLQLFTYLDVVLDHSKALFNKEGAPAGVLYYHIQDSLISANSELKEEEIKLKHYEQYKMNGYTIGEKGVSALFDDKLEAGDKSDIIKVAYTKNGYHKIQSKILTENEINSLRKHAKKSIIDSVEAMTQGNVDIKPVMYKQVATCKYCDYHAICKFDPKLRENNYHEITKIGDSKDIIDAIVSEFGSDKFE